MIFNTHEIALLVLASGQKMEECCFPKTHQELGCGMRHVFCGLLGDIDEHFSDTHSFCLFFVSEMRRYILILGVYN